ncbi:HAMP domain-containing sensor histidine kinase [Roseisolibacter sp. H3M3-2]|uniref:sensor histidine kinase n=1 Tax=Roseisolibacter sp. H3M3-2 TaxID=3031323 RepID=UPI0023DC8536|nr:HAMP domain-containing sensor histidine kinase [Roseisolibacter sp. H3M3-2]MDF1502859.1 HAMP domain-containing sensor histidine kinase [Roseisolibacter sp. H3M3-2]
MRSGDEPPSPRVVPPLRLVTDEPEQLHPLTTRATPLLPPREAAGQRVDVWEEVDRAAAWVSDRCSTAPSTASRTADRRERDLARHALRVLCVALRGAVADGGAAVPPELPWSVSLTDLLRALRQRLLDQATTQHAAGEPSADPRALLAVLAACERLEDAARHDVARVVVEQLSGARALELLVEVAHDMRSPLGSILFLVEQMRAEQAGPVTAAQERQLGLVYGAAFGLTSLVGDVMELARGGDRLAAGEPAPVSLAQLFEAVRGIVQPIAEEKGLQLVVHAPPAGARVGHGPAIQRVLLNLVTNALKFTPAGRVELRAEDEPGGSVRFTIVDTGRGIPPRVLATLFQTFRERPDARDFAFSSAGLGLAICRKLVRAMGGELRVDSEVGRGTRFEFSLPLPHASLV